MRKEKKNKNENIIEIQEDVRVPNSDVILEKGDRIEVLQEKMFDYDNDDVMALVTLAQYAKYSRDFMGFPEGSVMERQFDVYLKEALQAIENIKRY